MENDEKTSLELKKLALEIAEMERPWWKRPAYILAALPTLLAIIALSVGFLNGFFSAQATKLENQKHDLQAEIKEFEGTRNGLIAENERLRQVAGEKIRRLAETMGRLDEKVIKMKMLTSMIINSRSQGRKLELARIEFMNRELDSGFDDLREQLAALVRN